MDWYYYLIIAIALVFFIYLLISFICYRIVFFNKEKYDYLKKSQKELDEQDTNSNNTTVNSVWDEFIKYTSSLIKENDEIKPEDVYIKSYDNRIMHAHYFCFDENAPTVICCHGYKAEYKRDSSVMLMLSRKFTKYNILALDQRGCGESETMTICFGAKEKFDLLAWTYYLIDKNKDAQIFYYGLSMGAATVLLGAELEDLPTNVKGVIADSPYDSLKNACITFGGAFKIKAKPLLPFVYSGATLFGHFNVKDADAIRNINNLKVPTLIIHGDKDVLVSVEGSKRMAEANPNIKLIINKGTNHVSSFVDYKEEYQNEVMTFMKECLK